MDVATLKDDVAILKEDVSVLKQDMVEVKSDIKKIHKVLHDHEGRISHLEYELA